MRSIWFYLVSIALINVGLAQDKPMEPFWVPKTWDEKAIATLDLPRADSTLQVAHVSTDYYYSLPIRRFYKSYPVYHPSKEPKPDGKDYLDWLKEQPPQEILHDFSTLKTEADWESKGPALGKDVFEAPIADNTSPFLGLAQIEDVRNSEWYQKSDIPFGDDGLVPYLRYVVTDQGVRLGTFACAMCHTRVEKLPDEKRIVVQGAQGNFPFDRVLSNIPGPPGHQFGLELESDERKALIAFLKTL